MRVDTRGMAGTRGTSGRRRSRGTRPGIVHVRGVEGVADGERTGPRPRPAQSAATAFTASASPEITTASGALTAARATLLSWPASGGHLLLARLDRDHGPALRPACISLPRAATSRATSATDQRPATWAAPSSPIEWPARSPGIMPWCSSSRYRAISTCEQRGLGVGRPVQRPVIAAVAVAEHDRAQRLVQVPSSSAHRSSRASAKTGNRRTVRAPYRCAVLPAR